VTIYTAAITLFLVMDPLGNIPVFLSVLKNCPPHRRVRIIAREMIIALAILTVFLFFGKYILSSLDISGPALSIGGGVVLFLIALRMIFPPRDNSSHNTPNGGTSEPGEHQFAAGHGVAADGEEPLLVPLAVPLVAGPSSMAMVILISTQYPERMLTWFLSLLIAWLAGSLILVSSEFLRRHLGHRVIIALERLMGMLLTTVAVEMLLRGIDAYLA
jgi:multiple antibiotic resistance protein